MVGHLAVGVGGAWVSHSARVQTFPVDAGVVQRTFGVISAFRCIGGHYVGCNLQTLDSRIASVAYGTRAA